MTTHDQDMVDLEKFEIAILRSEDLLLPTNLTSTKSYFLESDESVTRASTARRP
jgi:hypothetical protein